MHNLTYLSVMDMLTEYIPDAPVTRADGFIRALLEEVNAHESDPKLSYMRAQLMDEVAEFLVEAAMDNSKVMDFLAKDQKIHAIKELRSSTGCSLVHGKNAVEDPIIAEAVQAIKDEWSAETTWHVEKKTEEVAVG